MNTPAKGNVTNKCFKDVLNSGQNQRKTAPLLFAVNADFLNGFLYAHYTLSVMYIHVNSLLTARLFSGRRA